MVSRMCHTKFFRRWQIQPGKHLPRVRLRMCTDETSNVARPVACKVVHNSYSKRTSRDLDRRATTFMPERIRGLKGSKIFGTKATIHLPSKSSRFFVGAISFLLLLHFFARFLKNQGTHIHRDPLRSFTPQPPGGQMPRVTCVRRSILDRRTPIT